MPEHGVELEDVDGRASISSHASNRTTDTGASENALVPPLAPLDRGRQAYLVLLGCALLQMPGWGFAVSFGVLQEFYTSKGLSTIHVKGDISSLGTIGTTLNGIIYLSMPLLFGLFIRRLAHRRKLYLILGILLSVASLIVSAYANQVWQLIVLQGVVQGLGASLMYSASTVYLDEWFVKRKGWALGTILSVKSTVGVVTPLMFSGMLNRLGLRDTLLIWAGIVAFMSFPSLMLLHLRIRFASTSETNDDGSSRRRKLSWSFLRHPTFYIFFVANILFSASYGVPQTYLSAFASSVLHFDASSSALMLVALNIPSILASYWFGLLSDGNKSRLLCNRSLGISAVSALSALGSAIPVFLLWGLVPSTSPDTGAGIALVVLFAVIYGFFSGGYSATWGGVVKEISNEGERHNEAVDTALVYGMMNGGRGIGFVTGGLTAVELLKVGSVGRSYGAYGSNFGTLIVFTGCGAALGGLCALYRGHKP